MNDKKICQWDYIYWLDQTNTLSLLSKQTLLIYIDEIPWFFRFLKLDFIVGQSEDVIFIVHMWIMMLSWLRTWKLNLTFLTQQITFSCCAHSWERYQLHLKIILSVSLCGQVISSMFETMFTGKGFILLTSQILHS